MQKFENPFRPGAGHTPPYLAGRDAERAEFSKLLRQSTVMENLVLTGLRGVGKTVLLEEFRPIATGEGWLWAGNDLSESASVSESSLAQRFLVDLSVVTSGIVIEIDPGRQVGFAPASERVTSRMDYEMLAHVYDSTPGLVMDKLKAVLEFAAFHLGREGSDRLVFAYDEAQNLADNDSNEQYPLSLLLDTFQSLQRKGIRFMLVLTGLPTLFPKLVEARTYAERMFRVVQLDRLTESESRDAVELPIQKEECPVTFRPETVARIVSESGGYPYFIQFYGKEIFDVWKKQNDADEAMNASFDGIQRKLDIDFFSGRWARLTDRQREMIWTIAQLEHPEAEFEIPDVVDRSKSVLDKPFSASHTNQMLASLAEKGFVYKTRTGKYTFAVPLLKEFVLRNYQTSSER